MRKNLLIWQVGGLTFTAVIGTILHFLFQWVGIDFFASFSAVNESTWEHMKLVFIPSFIFAIIQSLFVKGEFKGFWLIKLIGIFFGTLLIPILFYTIKGSFGEPSAIVNILIFFLSVGAEYFVELFLFNNINSKLSFVNGISFVILLVVLLLFIVFSFYPPKVPLFLDPVTNKYGIVK